MSIGLRHRTWIPLATLIIVLPALASLAFDRAASAASSSVRDFKFTDASSQAAEFIGDTHSIALTPEQKATRDRALSELAAPCCEEFSAATPAGCGRPFSQNGCGGMDEKNLKAAR